MDVRIGVTHVPRELTIEIDDSDRDDTMGKVESALSGAVDVLRLTDKRGRDFVVPVATIGYVELGSADSDRRIGFSG